MESKASRKEVEVEVEVEIEIEENKKPFPRARTLSSKENMENFEDGETSFRVYYGAKGASIPFMWESQPGTPKHPIFHKNDTSIVLPPLTPPPSYSQRACSDDFLKKKSSKNMIFRAFLSSIIRRRHSCSHVNPTSSLSFSNSNSSPLSWSSSSTNSSSSLSSPRKKCNKSHRRSFSFCSPREKSPLFYKEEEDQQDVGYYSSKMCFGFKKQQGCYSMQDMKDALFSIKGH
ncbi:unnamed protein product [Amaranthus hypochondriacus]